MLRGSLRVRVAGCALLLALSHAAATIRAEQMFLGNGIRVVVEERPATETVAIRLLVGGGDLDDPPRRPGVSDLHAALLLRGTRDRTGFALARAAEELGGRLSSSSRPLAESVSLHVPTRNFEAALRLVAETLLEPRLDPSDLAKEKTLLISSLATARDQPMSVLEDEIYRSVFPAHALSRLGSLTPAQVAAVTIEDVRLYQRSRLEPARLALIAVGNCLLPRVQSVAVELLGHLAPPARPEAPLLVPAVPPPTELSTDLSRHVTKRTTQSIIALALPTGGVSDSERPAFAILKHLLTGFQERLYGEIREKRGYAYWISAHGEEFPRAGAFAIATGAKEKYFPEIERVVRSELSRVASQPIGAEELRRAVRYLTTEEARRDETNAGRAAVLAAELVEGAPLRSYEQRVARLRAVTAEEVRSLARRLFAGKHLAVVTLY